MLKHKKILNSLPLNVPSISHKMSLLKNLFKRKQAPTKTCADFWDWFKQNGQDFFKAVKTHDNIEKDFFNKISPKLNELKEGFFFLTGMFDTNTAELVLTADGDIKNIFFVEELVKAAPKIDGWMFTALKPALAIENVSIGMAGYKFTGENISFYSTEHGDYPDKIDITVVHQDMNEQNRLSIMNGIYLFLDNFLGELNFVETIDNLEIISNTETGQELVAIEKLKIS